MVIDRVCLKCHKGFSYDQVRHGRHRAYCSYTCRRRSKGRRDAVRAGERYRELAALGASPADAKWGSSGRERFGYAKELLLKRKGQGSTAGVSAMSLRPARSSRDSASVPALGNTSPDEHHD